MFQDAILCYSVRKYLCQRYCFCGGYCKVEVPVTEAPFDEVSVIEVSVVIFVSLKFLFFEGSVAEFLLLRFLLLSC